MAIQHYTNIYKMLTGLLSLLYFAGIVHIACHFYKKALIMEPECKLPKVQSKWSYYLSQIFFVVKFQVFYTHNSLSSAQMLTVYIILIKCSGIQHLI